MQFRWFTAGDAAKPTCRGSQNLRSDGRVAGGASRKSVYVHRQASMIDGIHAMKCNSHSCISLLIITPPAIPLPCRVATLACINRRDGSNHGSEVHVCATTCAENISCSTSQRSCIYSVARKSCALSGATVETYVLLFSKSGRRWRATCNTGQHCSCIRLRSDGRVRGRVVTKPDPFARPVRCSDLSTLAAPVSPHYTGKLPIT